MITSAKSAQEEDDEEEEEEFVIKKEPSPHPKGFFFSHLSLVITDCFYSLFLVTKVNFFKQETYQ